MAGLGFVLLALALFDSSLRFIDNPVMRKIGEVSFSIYLLHHLVIHYGAGIVVKALNVLGLGMSGDAAYFVAFAIISALSVALAMVTYRLIEAPSIALGARLSKLTTSRAGQPITGQAEPAK